MMGIRVRLRTTRKDEMKDYSQIVSKVTSVPWMMMPSSLKMMLEILDAHIEGTITRGEIEARLSSTEMRNRPGTATRSNTVGIMPLHGPIFPKANLMTEMSGAVALDSWVAELRQMVEDDSIGSIVLDIDSPGGMSSGIAETAQYIREAREIKPIYAIANTLTASAAYGLAAQATQVYGTLSSTVGSIGTYLVHTDDSALLEKIGVKETVVKAGRFKAIEMESLTPESKATLQEYVDDVNDRFIYEIAQGRGMTEDQIRGTDAKVFAADRALSVGLIDGITTMEGLVGEILETGGITLGSTAPASKQSYDADKEHSEPGTGLGGEPTPREAPEEGDPAIEGGWRRDPPPPAYEETEEAVNREWLEARATALGVEFSSDTSDEDLAGLVAEHSDGLVQLVTPLREATENANRARDFAREFPEQAARMAALEQSARESNARAFAEGFTTVGDTGRGYSPQMRDQISDAYLAIESRQFTTEDLNTLLTAAASNLVPLGEAGSSRTSESGESTGSTGDFQADRRAFAQLVENAMKDDNLTQDAAIAHVSQTHPELARAYAIGHVGR